MPCIFFSFLFFFFLSSFKLSSFSQVTQAHCRNWCVIKSRYYYIVETRVDQYYILNQRMKKVWIMLFLLHVLHIDSSLNLIGSYLWLTWTSILSLRKATSTITYTNKKQTSRNMWLLKAQWYKADRKKIVELNYFLSLRGSLHNKPWFVLTYRRW